VFQHSLSVFRKCGGVSFHILQSFCHILQLFSRVTVLLRTSQMEAPPAGILSGVSYVSGVDYYKGICEQALKPCCCEAFY